MGLKLTFTNDPGGTVLEAEDATGILDAWNALPWWRAWDGPNFAQRIVDFSGAEVPGGMPAADEEILPAVVEALNDIELERT